MKYIHRKKITASIVAAVGLMTAVMQPAYAGGKQGFFDRIATFPIYKNLDLTQGDELSDETVAEIVAASEDGKTLLYTDSEKERLGFVDISKPSEPKGVGFLALPGEPTSVAVYKHYALVAVNTSESYVAPSGALIVVDISMPSVPVIVASIPMGGQPDSVAVAPHAPYAAVVIENERDEDLNDGILPQLPPGYLNVITMKGSPSQWAVKAVDLTGFADIAPSDPEPEYVDINRFNVAAVSLQENNHMALVYLPSARVIHDFPLGSAQLHNVDNIEDDVINPSASITVKREPDAITWANGRIVTANEGDYEGGSRGFSAFNFIGKLKYESGETLEHRVIRAGHYPEGRSENKGNEPEGVEFAYYGSTPFLFVGSERANTVTVYKDRFFSAPKFHQTLPTGVGPEGLLALPKRGLFVVASEKDDVEDGFRSALSIYKLKNKKRPFYPQIKSSDDGLIGWGALSGLAADVNNKRGLYAVHDSFYKKSSLYKINVQKKPALITEQIPLMKSGRTVNYDLEGIAQAANGDFWLVSEGKVGTSHNLLIKAAIGGEVLAEYMLPEAVQDAQRKHGFEGVAILDDKIVVAFQREWDNDPVGLVRLGVFNPVDESWAFIHYPIDSTPLGWVGLSELVAINDSELLVIERDNQQGPNAAVKKIYRINFDRVTPIAEGGTFPVVSKTLVRDLLPDLKKTSGWVVDKVEGAAIAGNGKLYIVSDNDGVDDATGETRFINLGRIIP